jgi:hypothetical protein
MIHGQQNIKNFVCSKISLLRISFVISVCSFMDITLFYLPSSKFNLMNRADIGLLSNILQ